MATISDSQAVFGVVLDAIRVLDWSAGEESRLVRADGESVPVLAEELILCTVAVGIRDCSQVRNCSERPVSNSAEFRAVVGVHGRR